MRGLCKPLGSLSFCIEEKLKGCKSHLETHIEGPYFDKANICVPILRALPDWFAIETAILHYATEIDILPTFLAIEASHTIGFLSIKQHTPYSAEVYVMAVLPDAHHKGVGRSLMGHAHEWLKSRISSICKLRLWTI